MIDTLIKRRKARKTWMLRVADSERLSDIRCAGCNERAPPIPVMSRFSDAGLLVRMWCCPGCGNQWITSTRVTS